MTDADESKENKAPVIEIFGPTIQGEGPMCGKRTFFVRFGGCPYRCSWCDTPYAVFPDQVKKNALWVRAETICAELELLGAEEGDWITLTGGDPVMWNEVIAELIREHRGKFKFQVETQGSLWQSWLEMCDCVVVSPKPPSSGMVNKFDPTRLRDYAAALGDRLHIKIVVFDNDDFIWATSLRPMFEDTAFYLSAGTPQLDAKYDAWTNKDTEQITKELILDNLTKLAYRVLETPELRDVTVLPQMHVLMWGTKRGV